MMIIINSKSGARLSLLILSLFVLSISIPRVNSIVFDKWFLKQQSRYETKDTTLEDTLGAGKFNSLNGSGNMKHLRHKVHHYHDHGQIVSNKEIVQERNNIKDVKEEALLSSQHHRSMSLWSIPLVYPFSSMKEQFTAVRRTTKEVLNDESSSSNQQDGWVGWTPSAYPDPTKRPDLCQIPNNFLENVQIVVNNNTSHVNETSIKLCDPDTVLNHDELTMVGNSMLDFNSRYGYTSSNNCTSSNKDENNIISVAQEWKIRTNNEITGAAFDLDHDSTANNKILSMGGRFVSSFEKIEIGVAIVDKIDVSAILDEFQFFSYDDETSMLDEAAQLFASMLHNQWFDIQNGKVETETQPNGCNNSAGASGILLFISVEDRVCFISSGGRSNSVLPWWRLERVVEDMRGTLRLENYGDAIIGAIRELSKLIEEGPPTLSEKLHDFSSRFGLVLLFSLCTFVLAVYGEIRERQSRYKMVEVSTYLNKVEEEKARMLQRNYDTTCCPICLEDFRHIDKENVTLQGIDGKHVKMLRCGHVFCLMCWRAWAHNPSSNPFFCPVCRQDVTGSISSQIGHEEESAPLHRDVVVHNNDYGSLNTSLHSLSNVVPP